MLNAHPAVSTPQRSTAHLCLAAGRLLLPQALQILGHLLCTLCHLAAGRVGAGRGHEVHLDQQLSVLVDQAVQLLVLRRLERARRQRGVRRRRPRSATGMPTSYGCLPLESRMLFVSSWGVASC